LEIGKFKTFVWGGILGGLIGLVLSPRRRRRLVLDPSLRHLEETHAFSSAPCYVPDDRYT
jgi:hypothetical protein